MIVTTENIEDPELTQKLGELETKAEIFEQSET